MALKLVCSNVDKQFDQPDENPLRGLEVIADRPRFLIQADAASRRGSIWKLDVSTVLLKESNRGQITVF